MKMSIEEMVIKIKSGELTSEALVQSYIEEISKIPAYERRKAKNQNTPLIKGQEVSRYTLSGNPDEGPRLRKKTLCTLADYLQSLLGNKRTVKSRKIYSVTRLNRNKGLQDRGNPFQIIQSIWLRQDIDEAIFLVVSHGRFHQGSA